MLPLAYLCAGGIVWMIGLVLLARVRLRQGMYTALSLLFALVGLFAFYVFSWATGLIHFGISTSWNYPDDYLARGIFGIVIMLIPIAGMLSPVLAAWMCWRSRPPRGMRWTTPP